MKTINLVLLFISISLCGYSQEYLQKGKNLISGSTNISSSTLESSSELSNSSSERNNYSLNTYYGKFVKDKLAIGGGVNAGLYRVTNIHERLDTLDVTELSAKSYQIGINIFARRYISFTDKFGTFVGARIGLNRLFNTQGEQEDRLEFTNFLYSANAEVGLYYFIFDRLSLSTRLGFAGFSYDSDSYSYDDRKSDRSGFNFSLINSISLDQGFTITYFF